MRATIRPPRRGWPVTIWQSLERYYLDRQLPLREAHKQQCYFPSGSQRLSNPVGTAWAFMQTFANRQYITLPGPPRELEGIWDQEVAKRLTAVIPNSTFRWVRWTCLGAPESEVAELVEAVIANSDLEVGYRAAVPYVKVKLSADSSNPEHQTKVAEVELALEKFIVGRGLDDLAVELLQLWPEPEIRLLDEVSDGHLIQRLYQARNFLKGAGPKLKHTTESETPDKYNLIVRSHGEGFLVAVDTAQSRFKEAKILPYRISMSTERGKRSAAEWALWNCVRILRISIHQS